MPAAARAACASGAAAQEVGSPRARRPRPPDFCCSGSSSSRCIWVWCSWDTHRAAWPAAAAAAARATAPPRTLPLPGRWRPPSMGGRLGKSRRSGTSSLWGRAWADCRRRRRWRRCSGATGAGLLAQGTCGSRLSPAVPRPSTADPRAALPGGGAALDARRWEALAARLLLPHGCRVHITSAAIAATADAFLRPCRHDAPI